jgi:hypothetical protein
MGSDDLTLSVLPACWLQCLLSCCYPALTQRSDLETPTNNANGSLPVTWVRYNTAERWLANWIPSSNIREQPVDAAGWRALGASGLTLKVPAARAQHDA